MKDTSPTRSIPSLYADPFDTIVFGGGYGGFAAARHLASSGKRVLLCEPRGALLWESGRAFHTETGAWTPAFLPFAQCVASVTGVSDEWFDGAAAEFVANDLIRADGPELLYDAIPFAAGLVDGLLASVALATKSGLVRVQARQWIDASEEGTLARLADPLWRPRDPVSREVKIHWQRFRWSAAASERRSLEVPGIAGASAEWGPSQWAGERTLTLVLPGGSTRFLDAVLPTLRAVRDQHGDALHEAFVSHASFIPYPVYARAEIGLASPVANLVLAVPGAEEIAVASLADRFELGLSAARALAESPMADTRASDSCCFSTTAPAEDEADVAVAGVGTGGVMAAVAAARSGASVAAFELGFQAGGVGVGSGISSYYYGFQGGLQEEVDARVRDVMPLFAPQGGWAGGFHPDAKRVVVEGLLQECGVRMNLGAMLARVDRRGAFVVSAALATLEGPRRLSADAWIDATGDGDLCALAGCRYRKGRKADGRLHTYTQSCGAFVIEDARLSAYLTNPDSGPVDPTDCLDSTRARRRGIDALCMPVMNSLNRRTHLSPQLGIRQGRTIETDYALSLDDLVERRAFEDGVGCTGSHYDNHANDYENESLDAGFYVLVAGLWALPTACEIPYRVMLPRGLDNVWIACRAAGATEEANHSFRMQRDIQRLGEVAGLAAAIACAARTDSRRVDLVLLKSKLGQSGALPPPTAEGSTDFGRARLVEDWVPLAGPAVDTEAAVQLAMNGDGRDAGLALWRIYRARPAAAMAPLRLAVRGADARSVWRAAALLGAWGDCDGRTALERIVASGDAEPSIQAPSARLAVPRSHVAAMLLARGCRE